MQIPFFPLGACLTIEVDSCMPPGALLVTERTLYTRHMSELLLTLAGATWHPNGSACPTWTDECACMVDP